MANRIVDNVIIVDSAMGNLSVVGGASSTITNFHVIGFAFSAATTLGGCTFTGGNTSDSIVRFGLHVVSTNNGLLSSLQHITYASPLRLSEIKCPSFTAGTGWIYLA